MVKETDIYVRIALLEQRESEQEAKILSIENRLSYYDRLALKWAGGCMVVLGFGTLIGMLSDKLREKLIALFS